ncbi:uncharacterized protein LOC116039861 [Xyrichtys novacula]|uniref:Uncharacterized protein LOC116039861 n=1 Tax=Xyrichtys novacula TaxID=13765 RepID=A0AAV1FA02_XYRNO|nr:uncharacterized protein LOC116039861 [Xyrichtys novacula]
MPRKSKRSQVASQRWQRFHDIDFVSTGQADGIPQSSGEVNYIAQTEKPCSTQVSRADTVKKGNHSNYQSVSGSSQVRNENAVNQSGEQNVCASRSQASLKYGQSRNQQCTCNSLTFLAFLYEREHITRADLDRVLDKGDVMYRKVRKTVYHSHLTTDELPKQVPARRHTQIFDKSQLSRYAASCRYELKPVVFGDVNPSDAIPATESPSTSPSVTTTVINDDTSAPQMNTDVHENTECDMETEPEPLIDFSQCSVTLTGPESLVLEMNTTRLSSPWKPLIPCKRIVSKVLELLFEKEQQEKREEHREGMDLSILKVKPSTPYQRLPPLHLAVVKVKEERRVIRWSFDDITPRPTNEKTNRIVILTDGNLLERVYVFEAVTTVLEEGTAYVMKGYSLRGSNPPYRLTISKETKFFKSAPIEVTEELRARAKRLLCPVSADTELCEAKNCTSLMTVQGRVTEVSSIRKMEVKREHFPLQTIVIEQETCSTSTVNAMGAMEVRGRQELLSLLVDDGAEHLIPAALWLPLYAKMKRLPFSIQISMRGGMIVKASAVERSGEGEHGAKEGEVVEGKMAGEAENKMGDDEEEEGDELFSFF